MKLFFWSVLTLGLLSSCGDDKENKKASSDGITNAMPIEDTVGRRSSGPIVAGRFAMLAYSKSTGRGSALVDYGTRSTLATEALSRCGVSDCKIVAWTQGGCAALAVSRGSKGQGGVAIGRSQAEAQAVALGYCNQVRSDCVVAQAACAG